MWRAWGCALALALAAGQDVPRVQTVDAVAGAGVLCEGKLQARLEIAEGRWFPEAEDGASAVIQAFAEAGKPPQNPGPLLRVREGVAIELTLHNTLKVPASVFGLYQHPGDDKAKLALAAGETKTITFLPGAPGAYVYFASTTGGGFDRTDIDSQLNGVIVVDPADAPFPIDRILVLSDWFKPGPDAKNPGKGSYEVWGMNGKMWPYTVPTRLRTHRKQTWLVANATVDAHPMHLHGNYFTVERETDGGESKAIPAAARFQEVTHAVPAAGATLLTFAIERPGKWLFHCHMLHHTAPIWGLDRNKENADWEHGHMSGMAVGLEASGPAEKTRGNGRVRRLQLVLEPRAQKYERDTEGISARVLEKGVALPSASPLAGPVLELTRGVPVEIEIVNHMHAPTSIHWHGIELESYYDGVSGYGGVGDKIAPLIAPGATFTVRFTPPRAGTFVYHAHYRDMDQIGAGLYGALLVREPGPRPAFQDQVVLLAGDGAGDPAPFLINGLAKPEMTLAAGTTYRFRFINMRTAQGRRMRIVRNGELVQWTRYAKDGADLPPALRVAVPAEQMVMPGETYDFLFTPDTAETLSLETGRKDPEMKVPVRVVGR